MSQRKALVDRFGAPLQEPEGKPLTREGIVDVLNQLRAELNAMHRFNATFYAVMEEQHPGIMSEVIRRLEAELPREAKEGKVH